MALQLDQILMEAQDSLNRQPIVSIIASSLEDPDTETDLTEYLINSPVTIGWDIASPTSLRFSLSHGHLFDPSNPDTSLSDLIERGKAIKIKFGETVDSIEYWQNQGSFIIRERNISHDRGEYPSINVSCEDIRTMWKEKNIVATEHFDNVASEDVLSNILQEHSGLLPADIDLPAFENSHTLSHQFIDQDLDEIVNLISDHFGYFPYISVDGKFTARSIDLAREADHIYSGAEIINYTPDHTFSSHINRIIVKGESLFKLEVKYPVEIVGNIADIVGWWGGNEVIRVYYSEDKQRKCRNPFLKINTSIQEFKVFKIKGGGKEYISDTDPDGYYVDITIEAPDLRAVFIGIASSILAVGKAAVDKPKSGPYIFALSMLTNTMGYLLGSVAAYDYEIWASPVGYTIQTFQAEANDYVYQRQLGGLVVMESIDDPFCYNITTCKRVAEQELDVIRAQRKQVIFQKIGHLQEEIGDVIQIDHPYTKLPMKIFITNLTRKYQKGVGFTDRIEGWLV